MRLANNFRKIYWTEHSKIKMRQYGLSKQKLLRILYKPERKEQGIVPGTSAVMKTNPVKKTQGVFHGVGKAFSKWQKPRKAPGEIWLMYKDVTVRNGLGQERKIISAWRYPGISKPGEDIPIPEDIRRELLQENDNK